MLKLKLQYFGHLMQRVDSLEKTLMLGGVGGPSLLAFTLLPQGPPNLTHLRKPLGSLGMTGKKTSQFPCQWQTLLID